MPGPIPWPCIISFLFLIPIDHLRVSLVEAYSSLGEFIQNMFLQTILKVACGYYIIPAVGMSDIINISLYHIRS